MSVTAHSLGQQAKTIWTELTEATAVVGRIGIRLGRVIAQAEALDADGLTAWATKYLPDVADGSSDNTLDEYLRSGRVIVALESMDVDVSDVAFNTAYSLHKCLTHRVPDESDKAGSLKDLDLWAKGRVSASAWKELDANHKLLLHVWTTAKARGKAFPTKSAAADVMTAFGVFGSRGPKAGSSSGNTPADSAGSSSGSSSGNTSDAGNTDNTPGLSDADLSAIAREVGSVFGRVKDPAARSAFGQAVLPLIDLAGRYSAEAVAAIVRTEVQQADEAVAEAKAEADKAKADEDKAKATPAKATNTNTRRNTRRNTKAKANTAKATK